MEQVFNKLITAVSLLERMVKAEDEGGLCNEHNKKSSFYLYMKLNVV